MSRKVRTWSDVKRSLKLSEAEVAQVEREAADELEREIIEGDLRAIRELTGKTQVEAAKLLDMTQSELSRLERRDDVRLSTLRRLVECLGGELEVVAHFGDKAVKLRSV